MTVACLSARHVHSREQDTRKRKTGRGVRTRGRELWANRSASSKSSSSSYHGHTSRRAAVSDAPRPRAPTCARSQRQPPSDQQRFSVGQGEVKHSQSSRPQTREPNNTCCRPFHFSQSLRRFPSLRHCHCAPASLSENVCVPISPLYGGLPLSPFGPAPP